MLRICKYSSPVHPSDGKKAVLTGSFYTVSTVSQTMERTQGLNILSRQG